MYVCMYGFKCRHITTVCIKIIMTVLYQACWSQNVVATHLYAQNKLLTVLLKYIDLFHYA